MVVASSAAPAVGDLLRAWRRRRGLSQLDVSLDAAVSARHLSFVETGRSRPSRELVLHLAEHFDVPLRERNALLLAAGYAPAYGETPLDAETMAPVRAALDKVLAGHAPYPAVIVDRRWDLVSANAPALAILAEGVAPELLRRRPTRCACACIPTGSRRASPTWPSTARTWSRGWRRQLAAAPDPEAAALLEELRGYAPAHDGAALEPAELLITPLRLRALGARAAAVQHARDLRHRDGRDRRRAGDRVVLPGGPRDRGRAARGVRRAPRRGARSGKRAPLRSTAGRVTGRGGLRPARGTARGDSVRCSGAARDAARSDRGRTGGGARGARRACSPAARRLRSDSVA